MFFQYRKFGIYFNLRNAHNIELYRFGNIIKQNFDMSRNN